MSEDASPSLQKANGASAPSPGTIPTIVSPSGKKHIEWLKNVFGAEVKEIYYRGEKQEVVMHCSMSVNGGRLDLYDAVAQMGAHDADQDQQEPGGFLCHMCLDDPKATWDKAMANGSAVVEDLKVQSWGSLYGSFKDPFGFAWSVAKKGKDPVPGVVPYLLVSSGGCEKHIDWLKTVFKAEVKDLFHTDDNKVMHCDLMVNGGRLYLADGPTDEKPSGLYVHMDVPDPKALWKIAHENGASTTVELKVQFWGDLFGGFKDSFGFLWSVAEKEKKVFEKKGVIPNLCSPNCEKHIEWIKQVMDGEVKEIYRTADNTKIMHCSMAVNGGYVYLADRACTPDVSANADYKGDPQGFLCHLEVEDPNVIWKKATNNGATPVMDLEVQFWGGLFGTFKDPFGFHWGVLRR